MSPLILTPVVETSKPITTGMPLYRGMSDKTEDMAAIWPMNPLQVNLDSPSETVNLIFKNIKPQMHILEIEKRRGHFVSFSLQKKVSCYYATSDTTGDYKKSGYIATVKFPAIKHPITFVGSEPYIFECYDGTVWLDMRHLPTQWLKAVSRTLVDHELLLLRGNVYISKLTPVTPAKCDKSFLPWAKTGERIAIKQ